jgi:manganese transport protein
VASAAFADGAATSIPPESRRAWRTEPSRPSLQEAHASVALPGARASFLRKLFAFGGPGYLVAVGYMDPGNWATDIAGGSRFGYTLLSVILISNLMAMVLQALAARLGIVTGRDLAQACRAHYSRRAGFVLWVLCEVAIVACDLAEVIGSAIALQLLFGIPLVWGVCLTVADVLLILTLQRRGFRRLEAFVVTLILTIGACFAVQLALAQPDLAAIAKGLVPQPGALATNPAMLYVAVGIVGATVMPHNLYLHSSIVQTRQIGATSEDKRAAVRYATIDSTGALFFALFVNASILILAAAVFHASGHHDVADIRQAHELLAPLIGGPLAASLFAVALLASGQNSTITGTLAGQIVMEGFLDLRMRPWLRRLLTRSLAIGPALVVIALYGDAGAAGLLVASQVVLSLQLPFAVVPLILFTSDPHKMGPFANRLAVRIIAWLIAGLIIVMNVAMLAGLLWEQLSARP